MLKLLPRWQTWQTTDSLKGLSLHSDLQRCMKSFSTAQHLHVHCKLVLEVLFTSADERKFEVRK